jgi:nucleotide sugar dehydrogenase
MWSDVVEVETIRVPAVPVAPGVPGVVAVVGLSRIGVPLAIQCAARGWRVIVCDTDARAVESIKNGQLSQSRELELERALPDLLECGLLSATTQTAEAVACANVVIVVAPVQVNEKHQVRFQELDALTETIGRALQTGTLVSYEMPLPVGTLTGRIRPCLEDCSGYEVGRGFYLAYSPARVSMVQAFHDLRVYPKIVGGIDVRSTQVAAAFYRSAFSFEVLTVASPEEAEFAKLLEITSRDVNIALANEFACYADEHGLDVIAAMTAANSQPSTHLLQPGVGVGGSTLPISPYLLLNETPAQSAASDEKRDTPHLCLARTARQINDGMAEYALQRIEASTGPLWQRVVLVLGVAYRADIRETTLSSAYALQIALWQRGATVYVDDPLYTPAELQALGFHPLPPGCENEIDAIILQAAHRAYGQLDLRRFARCRVLLDGRNGLTRARVEEAGMRYIAPGNGGEDGTQRLEPFRGETRP